MRLRRRDFMKISAAAGVTVGVAGTGCLSTNVLSKGGGGKPVGEQGEWKPTSCQGCTTWCPAEVLVQEGRAVKVRGNRHSKQNHGTLCPKGHIGLQELYDPDRVKVPMKRTNPKKGKGIDPGFVPISWDEALDTIADKMMALRKTNESHKFVVFRGRYSYMRDIIYSALPKVFGSPNGISHSAICAEAEKFGPYYTEGLWDYRDYDLANTKYLVTWGCDPLSSNRQIPNVISKIGDVLDNATVVAVDPRLTATASKAHKWLPLKPGEDGALAVAMAHVILTKGLWSKEFVGNFNDGKNKFKAGAKVDESSFTEKESSGIVKWWNIELKDKTPEWAAKKTLIPAKDIIDVAVGLAKAAPNAMVWMGPGACMHVRGSYSAMAVTALNGLIGSVDHEGGTLAGSKIPVKKIPSYSAYQDAVAKKHSKEKKIDQRGYKEFPCLKKGKSGGGVITNNAADAILTSDPYDVKVVIGYMNNFVFSCSGAERWEKAMEKVPFFAHITTNASETTQYADIVLPSTITQYEKLGFVKTKADRHACCTLLQPVVKPLWDVYADETEVPWMLAQKLKARGFSNLADYFQKEFKDPETGAEPTDSAEFTEHMLKILTAPLWDGKAEIGGDQIKGWKAFLKRGMWNSDPYPFKKRWGGHFKTATHKYEFYSATLAKALKGHADKHKTSIDDILKTAKYQARGEKAFVPHYEEPVRAGSKGEYPFEFIDYKSKLNREGRSANTTWYHAFKKVDIGDVSGDDVLQINPVDAKRLSINNGDKIKVTSTVGSMTVHAKLWEGVRPGTVAKSYGQGHWAYGRVAAADCKRHKPRGGNNNIIIPNDFDRLSGSTVRNGGLVGVKIQKV